MKVKELKQVLVRGNQVISKNAVVPILENALVKDGFISFSDLETTLTIKLDLGINTVLPLQSIVSLLEALDDEDNISLSAVNKSLSIKVNGEEIATWEDLYDASDFPKTPTLDGKEFLLTSSEVSGLKKLIPFASYDLLRPAMTGIHVSNGEMIATDGHRLVIRNCNVQEESMILRRKLIENVLEEKDYTCIWNHPNLRLTSGDETITTRLIDERFPDYEYVFPSDWTSKVTINREEFLKTNKLACILSNTSFYKSILKLGDSNTLSCKDSDFGRKFHMSFQATVENKGEDPCEYIAYNTKFMDQILEYLDSEEIELRLLKSNSAIVINDKCLLMPMMVNEFEFKKSFA